MSIHTAKKEQLKTKSLFSSQIILPKKGYIESLDTCIEY